MGFRISETMMGTHEFHDGAGPAGRHPFGFRGRWGPASLREWLNPVGHRFLWQEMEGEVLVGGLGQADAWRPCRGTLELLYHRGRRIRYTFDTDIHGVLHRYVGQKMNIHLHNLPVSHTTCFGTLTEVDSGRLVSTSLTTFKFRDLPRFASTLRWARAN